MEDKVITGNKILRIQLLKFLWLPVFMLCINLNGAFAQDHRALLVDLNGQKLSSMHDQNASSHRLMKIIHLDGGQKSLREVLQDIADQAGLKLSYSEQLIPLTKKVNVKQARVTAEQALWRVLEGTSLRFGVSASGQLFFFEMQKANSTIQQEIVTGTVTDASTGETLPGVNVVVKGTSTGTATNSDGEFELTVESLQDTLVFSFIGYQTREIPINGRTEIDLALTSQAIFGEELVVVGYGVQRKSEVTGSVGVVSGKDLEAHQSSFNALQSLKGKVPGVTIFQNSGSPTGDNRVVIRGVGTINASSDPLYVVDGVQRDNINYMNPNNIESIEVLKDASSAAIYGARGANGVILITTKRGGDSEETTVSYDGSISLGRMEGKMDAMNAEEFMQVQKMGYENAPLYDDYAPGNEPKIDLSDERLFDSQGNSRYDTDWQEEATRTAISHDHQISIQSGGEKSSYGGFLNYSNKEGVFLNSWLERVNVKIVYDANPTEWFSLGTNLSISKNWENEIEVAGGGGQIPKRTMIEYPPIFPVTWSDGVFTNSTQVDGLTFEGNPNPVHRLLEEDKLRNRSNIFGNTYLEFQITPSLQLRSQFGIDNELFEARYYAPSNLIKSPGFPNGHASISTNETIFWQNENYLTYQNEFGSHRINSVLGASWQQKSFRGNSVNANGFPSDFFKYNSIDAATNFNPTPSSNKWDWTMNSYFTRTTYSYDDRYTLTFTGRVDGSSRFGKNNKYGFFPSVGASWLVSNEEFMSGVNVIDHMRIRSSYGITGNTEIGLFQSLATIGSGTTLIGGTRQSSSFVQRLPNPDLEWEKTKQFDLGLEFELFNQAVTLEADYYYKLTEDLLLERPVPTTTGFGSVSDNIGSVSNRGVDFIITTRNIQTSDFIWTTTLNFNYNKNRVESLGVNNEDIFPGPFAFGGSQTILRVGEPVNSFWGFERLGTWNTDEAAEAAEAGKIPGMAKRSNEKKILGNGMPDWKGAFINKFNYGNFDATIELQFTWGVDVMQRFLLTGEDRQGLTNGLSTQLYDSWTPDNQDTMVPRIRHTVLSGQDLAVDSHWIVDGSYLRGSLFSVGYSFEQSMLEKFGIRRLRTSVSLENAFVIHDDDFKGHDPEGTSHFGSQFGQNIIFYSYPKARTLSLGLNIEF